MKKYLRVFFVLFLLIIFSSIANAADIKEEQTTEKYLGAAQEKAIKKVEVVKETTRYKAKYFLSALQGYDNNVFLNSDRKKDTFSEGIFDASVEYPLSGRLDALGGASIHDITYWDATDASLVDTNLKFGLQGKLFWNMTLTALNNFEAVEYPSNGDGNYLGDKIGLTLRHKLPHNFFHAAGYEYFYKHFPERKALNGVGGKSDTKRTDNRNSLDYEIGVYLKKAMVKVFTEYYFNDSNDSYLDYYKYDSKRFGTSFIYLLAEKISTYLSFAYQRRNFSDRTVVGDGSLHERDNTYVTSAALFYDLTKSATLGLNYSYRQNDSNEPSQKYSGSITTLGLYYRF